VGRVLENDALTRGFTRRCPRKKSGRRWPLNIERISQTCLSSSLRRSVSIASVYPALASPTKIDSTTSASWIVWCVVVAIALLIVGLIISAPLTQALGFSALAAGLYKTFSFLCHQLPERSFHLAGHQFAVCSRCTGLYAGFAFATLALPLMRSLKRTETPNVIWLLLSAVPLALDFALTYFGLWQNNHFTRVTTGALFGAVTALYVVPGLIELSAHVRRRFKSEPPAVAGG
jgi:uncharacterized membrane protein